MPFYHSEETGTYHVNEAAPAKIVPGPQRHKWSSKLDWGGAVTCVKCGCVRRMPYGSQMDTYQMAGESTTTTVRPDCTGKKPETTKP